MIERNVLGQVCLVYMIASQVNSMVLSDTPSGRQIKYAVYVLRIVSIVDSSLIKGESCSMRFPP